MKKQSQYEILGALYCLFELMGQQGFWDFSERHQKLSQQKSFLVDLDELVSWETFRPILESLYDKPRKSPAGRKPIDVIVMFKLLVLQQMYNIADDELEYQVNDRDLQSQALRILAKARKPRNPDRLTGDPAQHQSVGQES